MAAPVKTAVRQVKPLLSLTKQEAHRRVIGLYRSWYREIPEIVLYYDIEKVEEDCKKKLREEFMKHANVTDLRVIDLLVVKGYMDFQEVATKVRPKGNLMSYWKPTQQEKPTDFMSKFLGGQD